MVTPWRIQNVSPQLVYKSIRLWIYYLCIYIIIFPSSNQQFTIIHYLQGKVANQGEAFPTRSYKSIQTNQANLGFADLPAKSWTLVTLVGEWK